MPPVEAFVGANLPLGAQRPAGRVRCEVFDEIQRRRRGLAFAGRANFAGRARNQIIAGLPLVTGGAGAHACGASIVDGARVLVVANPALVLRSRFAVAVGGVACPVGARRGELRTIFQHAGGAHSCLAGIGQRARVSVFASDAGLRRGFAQYRRLVARALGTRQDVERRAVFHRTLAGRRVAGVAAGTGIGIVASHPVVLGLRDALTRRSVAGSGRANRVERRAVDRCPAAADSRRAGLAARARVRVVARLAVGELLLLALERGIAEAFVAAEREVVAIDDARALGRNAAAAASPRSAAGAARATSADAPIGTRAGSRVTRGSDRSVGAAVQGQVAAGFRTCTRNVNGRAGQQKPSRRVAHLQTPCHRQEAARGSGQAARQRLRPYPHSDHDAIPHVAE